MNNRALQLRFLTPFLAILAALTAGCVHLPPGGALEFKTTMGVSPIWKVENDFKGIKVTEKTAKAADARVHVQVLIFDWETTGKDVALPNPPKVAQ